MEFSILIHMERIDENQCQKQLYQEYIELCLIAEKAGFSTIWTGEHHLVFIVTFPKLFNQLAYFSQCTATPALKGSIPSATLSDSKE